MKGIKFSKIIPCKLYTVDVCGDLASPDRLSALLDHSSPVEQFCLENLSLDVTEPQDQSPWRTCFWNADPVSYETLWDDGPTVQCPVTAPTSTSVLAPFLFLLSLWRWV